MRLPQPPSVQPPAPGAIAAVPAAVRAAVRAQAVISTVAEALAEVVANALDAGASEVNVDVALATDSLGFRVQDNGSGVPAASMALLGQRFATSKEPRLSSAAASGTGGSAASGAPPAPCPLGYRGEALAAIREAAGALEVTSRAAGSFETLTITLQPGGRAAGPALAPEQRLRQGTVVAVRNLFATQPVRRKALLASGLQREADRCRDVVLRMALLRPGVTFTLFDRGRRAFVLRLIKGRSELEGVTEFLGRPPQLVAALQPAPAAAFAISGYAALPPFGQPGTTRQCIYVNGRWVKAAPVARLVDSVFQQCYKPNVRLLEGQGEELQAVRKASNKHAAFVLHISCPPSEYELAHEAEGELVQFRSWEPLLGAVQHSLLAAWRLALSNSLLKQLEQLEGSGAGGPAAQVAGTAAAAAAAVGAMQRTRPPGGMSFQDWLQDQQGQDSYDAIQAQATATAKPAAAAAAAENAAGPVSGGSSRQRGWSGGQKLSGAKHTLASRLVRYNGVTALLLGGSSGSAAGPVGGPQSGGRPQQGLQSSQEGWEGSGAWLSKSPIQQQQLQQQGQQHRQHAVAIGPGEPAEWQQEEQELFAGWHPPSPAFQQEDAAPAAYSCQVLASRLPQHCSKQQCRDPPLQPLQAQVPGGTHSWNQAGAAPAELPAQRHATAWGPATWPEQLSSDAEQQAAVGVQEEQQPDLDLEWLLGPHPMQPARAVQQLRFGDNDAHGRQSGWWQQDQQPELKGMDLEEQRGCGQHQQEWDGSGCSLRLRLGSSEEVEALIASWGPASRDAVPDGPAVWTEAGGRQIGEQQTRGKPSSRLTAEERDLLQHLDSSPRCCTVQRPQSAPPHHRPWQRIEVVRQPPCARQLAEMAASGAAVADTAGAASGAGAEAVVAAAAQAAPPGRVVAQPQSHLQDTAIHQCSGFVAQTAPKGSGRLPPDDKWPAAASRGGTAMQQPPIAAQQQRSVAGPTAGRQAAVPDFLRPDAGLDELLASWRRPAAAAQPGRSSAAATGSSSLDGILSLDALSAAAFARLKPGSLSREQLGQARVLQQLDRKFVPIVCGSLLALVDQHAADERVQLERLRDLLLGPDGQPQAVGSHALRAPLPLDLTDAEQQLLEAYQHKAEGWGWRWMVPVQHQGRASGFGQRAAPVLTHMPLLWGTNLSAADLKLYLHHLHDTCGAGGLPAGVVRVLNSKACRGAIMFGDALHQGQCQALLEKLAATQLCFSCAHGRPTTAPVVDLRLLQQAVRMQADARAATAGNGVGVDASAAIDGQTKQKAGLSGLKARLQALVQ